MCWNFQRSYARAFVSGGWRTFWRREMSTGSSTYTGRTSRVDWIKLCNCMLILYQYITVNRSTLGIKHGRENQTIKHPCTNLVLQVSINFKSFKVFINNGINSLSQFRSISSKLYKNKTQKKRQLLHIVAHI